MHGLADTHAAKHFCCRTTVDVSKPDSRGISPVFAGHVFIGLWPTPAPGRVARGPNTRHRMILEVD